MVIRSNSHVTWRTTNIKHCLSQLFFMLINMYEQRKVTLVFKISVWFNKSTEGVANEHIYCRWILVLQLVILDRAKKCVVESTLHPRLSSRIPDGWMCMDTCSFFTWSPLLQSQVQYNNQRSIHLARNERFRRTNRANDSDARNALCV